MVDVQVGIPVTAEGLILAVGERCQMTVRFPDERATGRYMGIASCITFIPTFFLGGPILSIPASVAGVVFALVRKHAYKPLELVVKTRFSEENKRELALKLETYTKQYSCKFIDQVKQELDSGGALASILAEIVSEYLRTELGAVDVRHNCIAPKS